MKTHVLMIISSHVKLESHVETHVASTLSTAPVFDVVFSSITILSQVSTISSWTGTEVVLREQPAIIDTDNSKTADHKNFFIDIMR